MEITFEDFSSNPLYGNDAGLYINGELVTNLVIPEGVTSIGGQQFRSIDSLESVTIPSTVTSIGISAFRENSNLKTVIFVDNTKLESVGTGVFVDCYNLENVYIQDLDVFDTGSFLSKLSITADNVILTTEQSTTLVIPEGTTSIPNNAYRNVKNFTNVVIPNSVTSIGNSAFYGTNIENITIPNSVTSIGDYAFYGTNIESITIPSSVTSIGEYAFNNCENLKSITFQENSKLESIGNECFENSLNLKTVYFEGSDLDFWCYVTRGYRSTSSPFVYSPSVYVNGELLTDLVISEGVEYIEDDFTFAYLKDLKSVTIPSSVTSIGEYAFSGCSNLESVVIEGNSQLKTISSYAFQNCSSLKSIIIPSGVTSIGSSAFNGCYALKEVYNLSTLNIVSENSSNGYVGYYAPYIYTSLSEPSRFKQYGDYIMYEDSENSKYYLIDYVGSSNSLVLPNNLGYNYEIYRRAFYGDFDIISITIPSCVTNIGSSAFNGCYALKEVYNLSSMNIVAGSSDYGYVGNYASVIKTSQDIESGYKNYNDYIMYEDYVNNEFYLTKYIGTQTNLVLPNNLGYEYEIAQYAFYNNQNIISLSIPNCVTRINSYAFLGCSNLQGELVISDSVEYIGVSSFENCPKITKLTFSENSICSTIDESAFESCSAITEITLPASMRQVEAAFWKCGVIDSLYFLGDIEDWVQIEFAVEGYRDEAVLLYQVEEIYIKDELLREMTEIVIPEGVTKIGEGAFYICSNLTSITIPSSVTSIGIYAFAYCDNLLEVDIPSSVTSIREGAFYNCSNLNSITIPSSVTSIGEDAFSGCNIKEFYFLGNEEDWCNISFSSGSSNPARYSTDVYINNIKITTFEVPSTIKSIKSYAFYGFKNLQNIIIPSSVTSIGTYAFAYCENLLEVDIPSSVTSIGRDAFSNCSNLNSITIPSSVTSIGENAFYACINLESVVFEENSKLSTLSSDTFWDCGKLTTVVLPSSLKTCGQFTFANCFNIKDVYFLGSIEDWCNISFDDFSPSTNPLYSGADLYINNEKVTNLVIPEGVSRINNYAFYGNKSILSVTIPSSVTLIDEYAFCNSGIENVIFENNSQITNINEYAFSSCQNLKSIDFGTNSNLQTIGDYVFQNCSSLVSITLPSSITSLGNSVFRECSKLESVDFEENSQLTSIGTSLFYNCRKLKSLSIPKGITSIGTYAFYGCSNLESIYIEDLASWCNITYSGSNCYPLDYAEKLYLNGEEIEELVIPYGVTKITQNAFRGLKNIKSVVISSSVVSIEASAFYNCYNLESVRFEDNSQLTSIGSSAFYNCYNLKYVILPVGITSISTNWLSNCNLVRVYCEESEKPSSWSSSWISSSRPVYWAGEWAYDLKGKPIPTK